MSGTWSADIINPALEIRVENKKEKLYLVADVSFSDMISTGVQLFWSQGEICLDGKLGNDGNGRLKIGAYGITQTIDQDSMMLQNSHFYFKLRNKDKHLIKNDIDLKTLITNTRGKLVWI